MNPDRDPVTGQPIGHPVAETSPAPGPEQIRLNGRHVLVVPLDADVHGADLAEGAVGPGKDALWQYMAAGPFDDRESFQAYLVACEASSDPLFYAILDAGSRKAIGHASLMRIDRANRVIEVGNILYTPALQRTAGATEAMRLLAGYVFDLGYRRYEWKCNALNAPSRSAAARLGFSYEGLFRQAVIVKGRNRDTTWFSMLDGEWPQIRQGFDRWLSPENLEGGQSLRLGALTRATISDHRLRRATTADAPALAALQDAAYAPKRPLLGVEPVPLLTPAAEVLGRYEVWLADHEGEPAGALVLDPQPDHLMLWSVAVDPAHQGSGLGNTLLAAAESRARDLDLVELRLYTGDKLVRNIDWYARRGYATARVETLPDRRLVHMHKRLG